MSRLRVLVILGIVLVVVPLFGLLAMSWYSVRRPSNLGVNEGKLAACPAMFNCVSTQAGEEAKQMKPLAMTESSESAMGRLRSIVAAMPRTKIITSGPDYLHAEFRSRLFRFVDDVEFLADEKTGQIHFRSASRVGISDLGVNRRRMVAISESFASGQSRTTSGASPSAAKTLPQTDEQWRKVLTPEQFYVTRQQGTERAFSGEYWDNKEPGEYRCVCCDLPLFDSESKYESGTGWPSFFQPVDEKNVQTSEDYKLFWRRTEVHCSRCGAHLGHVFDDGPQPTGLRYCINSVALSFVKEGSDE